MSTTKNTKNPAPRTAAASSPRETTPARGSTGSLPRPATTGTAADAEGHAILQVLAALKPLAPPARDRVLSYARQRYPMGAATTESNEPVTEEAERAPEQAIAAGA